MGDEGTPTESGRPPVDEPLSGPPAWIPPPPSDGPSGYPPDYGALGYMPPYGYRGQPSGHWLHPLDVGRAFGAAWRLYRFNWRAMVAAVVILTVPMAIVSALYDAYLVGPAVTAWQDAYLAAVTRGDYANLPLPPAVSGPSLLISIVTSVVSVLATAAIVYLIGVAYRGVKESAAAGLRAAFGRLGSLVGALLLLLFAFIGIGLVCGLAAIVVSVVGFGIGGAGLGTFIGLIGAVGAVAAVLFFTLRWSMFVQAIMIDGLGAMDGLRRSWHLVHGSTWRVLGYFLLLFVILILVSIVAGIVLAIVALTVLLASSPGGGSTVIVAAASDPVYQLIVAVGESLLLAFLAPWWTSVLTLLYYDLRWQQGELRSPATQPVAGG